jgi:nitrate/TMAO reductase-like tetraheme cytochrome c subunit
MSDKPGSHQDHHHLTRNPVSYYGKLVALASLFLLVAAFVIGMTYGEELGPIAAMMTYAVFPGTLVAGVLLFLYGMRRESLRRRREGEESLPAYPRLDLNDPAARKRFTKVLVLAGLGVILSVWAVFNTIHFTESVKFCGLTCHSIMEPEHTAYLASPHARVGCVDCHVGAGASWYVRSKISGLKEVYHTLTNTVPRPIETPIKNLRPARETCEQCHWPQKFFGSRLVENPHFRYDEKNTGEQISLLLHTGGGAERGGRGKGIHGSMILSGKVLYQAVDRKRQVIPWTRVERADGSSNEYVSTDWAGKEKEYAGAEKRTVDCMDCHNRPTHGFPAAEVTVDLAMATDNIPSSLPWIKKVAVDAIVKEYPSSAEGKKGVRDEVVAFYAKNLPAVAASRKADVEKAAAGASAIYGRSVFPAMKVNWKTYPTNIGHRNWDGCFRCHDGKHVDKAGNALGKECTLCHTAPERKPLLRSGAPAAVVTGGWHPFELKGKHATLNCSRCHEAGFRPPASCAECHKRDPKAPMASLSCSACHLKEQERTPVGDCRKCHAARKGLHLKGGHPDASCTECHRPHGWKVEGREVCYGCHGDKKDHNGTDACKECHDFRG